MPLLTRPVLSTFVHPAQTAAIRIAAAELFVVRIPLRIRVRHARAARKSNTTIFVVLHGQDDRFGIGEALGRDYVTGDSPEDCLRALVALAPQMTGVVIEDVQETLRELRTGPLPPPAMCAVELAMLDLWSKATHIPIAAALRRPVIGSGVVTFTATYPILSGLKLAGLHLFYRTLLRMNDLKVKGTGNAAEDLAYVRTIRRAFRYPVRIRLDLNGALQPTHAMEYFPRLRDQGGVSWVEQPFPPDDWDSAARSQERFPDVVLCGDESLRTRNDVEEAARRGAFRAVNIRIAKHGGLLPALEVYDAAMTAGLQVQLGCLVGESSVLGFAGLHLAAMAGPLAHYEGGFGRYLIRWDPVRPSLTFRRGGQVPLTALPPAGLVPYVDLRRLRRAAVDHYRFEA